MKPSVFVSGKCLGNVLDSALNMMAVSSGVLSLGGLLTWS